MSTATLSLPLNFIVAMRAMPRGHSTFAILNRFTVIDQGGLMGSVLTFHVFIVSTLKICTKVDISFKRARIKTFNIIFMFPTSFIWAVGLHGISKQTKTSQSPPLALLGGVLGRLCSALACFWGPF